MARRAGEKAREAVNRRGATWPFTLFFVMRNLGVLPSMSMANLFSPLFGADTIDSCWGGEMAGMAKVDGESKMAEAREAVVIAACWG